MASKLKQLCSPFIASVGCISLLQILMSVLLMSITVMPILFVSIHVAVLSASVKQALNVSEVVVEVNM